MSTPDPVQTETTTPATPVATPAAATPVTTVQTPAAAPVWPETWRTQLSGGDEKELKRLERFSAPTDIYRSFRQLEQRLSSGELKANTPFPEKGTDAEKNAWRSQNGIPESSDKYDLSLTDGLIIGEADKPIIDDFLKSAHASNLPQEAVKAAIAWYFNFNNKEAETRAAADGEATHVTQEALRSEWGQEYKGNINRIMGLLDIAPPGVKDKLMSARGPDGTPIFADADSVRFFANLARELNPATTLVPGAGGNAAGAIDDEINKMNVLMADRTSEYWKGPKVVKNGVEDSAMAHRYRELVAAQQTLKKRAG